MRCVLQLAIGIALWGSSFASIDPVYNVTSGVEDYTLLVGRSMQITLDLAALKLATVKLRHADTMESIQNQQELVMQEMQQFDNSMVQHQALSMSHKHCVQKYKPIVPVLKDVNKNFTLCIYSAEQSAARLTQNAESYLSKATQIREVEVPTIYAKCNSSYLQESKVVDCVTQKVDTQLVQFNNDMDKFEISLQESLYTSSIIAAETTRCSFAVEKKVLASNGAALSLSDVCEDELKGLSEDKATYGINALQRKLMERLRKGSGSLN